MAYSSLLIKMKALTSDEERIKRFYYENTAGLSPHVKESGFRNPGNFCIWNPESWKFSLLESGILGLGIRNTGVGMQNPTNNSNTESKFH